MRKLFGITVVAMVALAIPFAAPAAEAAGGTTTCTGMLDPGTYHRVVVPENAAFRSARSAPTGSPLASKRAPRKAVSRFLSGTVTLANNTLQDPDGNEFVTNTIHGSMRCWGNDPAPQPGDSGGSSNIVTGQKTRQCTAV